MSAVTAQEIVEALRSNSHHTGESKRKKELADRIEQHGIAPPDCVKQADEETHRRVDEAVRDGRIEDRRAAGEAMNLSREEIIRMAREAGFARYMTDGEIGWQMFEHFANAAYATGAAAERESCAKVCDSASDYTPGNLLRAGAIWCAFNIRTRGNGDKK